jgi:hypothetical protein
MAGNQYCDFGVCLKFSPFCITDFPAVEKNNRTRCPLNGHEDGVKENKYKKKYFHTTILHYHIGSIVPFPE